MVKVIATSKGYFGGIVRDIGEGFNVPDEVWDDNKKRPSWARIAVGEVEAAVTSAPAGATSTETKPAATNAVEVPADWANLHGSKRKQLAKVISGSAVADLATADNIISAYVEANKPAPFEDAPEPQTVAQAQKATGGIEPDWVAPRVPQPVAD